MLNILIAVLGVALILMSGEFLWKKRILKGEFARKYVHILCASYVAFWPYFLPRLQIVILGLLFIVVLVVVKKLKLFKSIRAVQRANYGEIWYALGICIAALVFGSNLIFTFAILQMALADGFAAVVGVALKRKANIFKFNGLKKSQAGSLTFFGISFILNITYWAIFTNFGTNFGALGVTHLAIYSVISASFLTIAEVISPRGSDNIIIPILAGTLLVLPALI